MKMSLPNFTSTSISTKQKVWNHRAQLEWKCFYKYVNHCLFYEYGKTCVRFHALQLDSSTTQKFIQHLIYPEVIFSDHLECGNFVKKIAAAAKSVLLGGHFRLLKWSKLDPDAHLVVGEFVGIDSNFSFKKCVLCGKKVGEMSVIAGKVTDCINCKKQ